MHITWGFPAPLCSNTSQPGGQHAPAEIPSRTSCPSRPSAGADAPRAFWRGGRGEAWSGRPRPESRREARRSGAGRPRPPSCFFSREHPSLGRFSFRPPPPGATTPSAGSRGGDPSADPRPPPRLLPGRGATRPGGSYEIFGGLPGVPGGATRPRRRTPESLDGGISPRGAAGECRPGAPPPRPAHVAPPGVCPQRGLTPRKGTVEGNVPQESGFRGSSNGWW